MLKNWDWPEVSILGADQKDRGLWRRECGLSRVARFTNAGQEERSPWVRGRSTSCVVLQGVTGCYKFHGALQGVTGCNLCYKVLLIKLKLLSQGVARHFKALKDVLRCYRTSEGVTGLFVAIGKLGKLRSLVLLLLENRGPDSC